MTRQPFKVSLYRLFEVGKSPSQEHLSSVTVKLLSVKSLLTIFGQGPNIRSFLNQGSDESLSHKQFEMIEDSWV